MATVTRHMNVQIDEVYAALIDPETYPEWLVGAKEIRAVDESWPEAGSRFHHRVGLVGPFTIADSTKSLGTAPGRRLCLEARARPAGRARVDFELTPEGDATLVRMREHPLGLLSPATPLLDPITMVRNHKSLRQLEQHLLTVSDAPRR
jgi:uncharacterized protein YndB with AHSA1/START domain